ncbi:LysR substrate-binding domain-containing protein [Niallia sp. 03133]|uniref:LysR substrate-binding domain-containing protein n=1 Tax=Niallia sp. 03133 TaxID=3458060 RepID=UPI00404421BA
MNKYGLEAFLAIVRHKRLTDAAKSLFLSQSTLSHRLLQFEKELGIKLIERGRGIRSLTLTPGGEEFLPIARKLEELIQQTHRIKSRSTTSVLSIGAVDSIHSFILPPVYQELNKYASHLNLTVKTHQSIELYWLLEHGEVDVAFTLLEQPMPKMTMSEFLREPMVVMYKMETNSCANKLLNEENLDFSKQIFIDWGSSFRTWYDYWIKTKEVYDYSTIQLDTASLLLTFAQEPCQWSIVPLSIAQQFHATSHFDYFRLADSPPDRVCYKIENRGKSSRLEGLRILDECLKVLKADFDGKKQFL